MKTSVVIALVYLFFLGACGNRAPQKAPKVPPTLSPSPSPTTSSLPPVIKRIPK